MNAEQILKDLKDQYQGQLVFYPKDLVRILGITGSGVDQLITRGHLPFDVKMIGGRRCVDIYELAEWLAKVPVLAESLEIEKLQGQPHHKGTTKSSKGPTRASLGSKIMEMRYGTATALRKFAANNVADDERIFILEVAEEILFAPGVPEASFVVTGTRYDFEGSAAVHNEQKMFSERYSEVRDRIERFQRECLGAQSAKLIVRRNRRLIYSAFLLFEYGWIVKKDEQWW